MITADDGHRTEMLPLVRAHKIPVPLFINPSAISNASCAMTWDELRELAGSGVFDVQSHTYWHPNFAQKRRRLSTEAFAKLVDQQLRGSKERIERELGHPVDLLA